jgi:hypothetical protein
MELEINSIIHAKPNPNMRKKSAILRSEAADRFPGFSGAPAAKQRRW